MSEPNKPDEAVDDEQQNESAAQAPMPSFHRGYPTFSQVRMARGQILDALRGYEPTGDDKKQAEKNGWRHNDWPRKLRISLEPQQTGRCCQN